MDQGEIDVGVLGKRVGRGSVRELAKRLHRDPSVISRLCSAYAAARDHKLEKTLLQQLRKKFVGVAALAQVGSKGS
jgi:hypothetical protein